MEHQTFQLHHFTNAISSPQQTAHYSTTNSSAPQAHTNMAASQNHQPSSYQASQQAPRDVCQPSWISLAPVEPLEQRILDLLYPYRDECFQDEDAMTSSKERMALILSENIAFLIRHNQASYGKQIHTNDVSIASRNWKNMKQNEKSDVGPAGIAIFVNGGNGYTHTVIRIMVSSGENAMECLNAQVDHLMLAFFPVA